MLQEFVDAIDMFSIYRMDMKAMSTMERLRAFSKRATTIS